MVELYNLSHSSTVLAVNTRFSSTGTNAWQQLTSILAARLVKFGL